MKKIVLYGDSNTYGYDPAGSLGRRYPAADRWADILAGGPDLDIRAYGLNGRMIPRHDADFAYLDQILMNTAPFDLFCIMLGTNDLLFQTEPDMQIIADRADHMLSCLLRRTAIDRNGRRILLLAPPALHIRDPYYTRHNEASLSFSGIWRALAGRYHTHFADTSEWQIGTAFDDVHFSAQGHHDFAAHMRQILSELFTPTP